MKTPAIKIYIKIAVNAYNLTSVFTIILCDTQETSAYHYTCKLFFF